MKRFLILSSTFLFILLGVTLAVKLAFGSTTSHHTEWNDWTIKSTTDCIQTECGKSDGTQNVTYQRQCTQVSGHGDNECDLKVCPEGYPNKSQLHSGYCYKGSRPDWPEDFKQMIDNIQTKTELDAKCTVEEPVQCEPIITPEPTMTPIVESQHENPITEASAPVCNDPPVKVPPTYSMSDFKRVDNDTIDLKWTVKDGHATKYGIYYGTKEDNLPWYTEVEGHDTNNITINDVPNGIMWFKVCSIGSCGDKQCGITVDP